MREEQIAATIRETGKIDSAEHARDAARATLRVLGQRLAGGETKDLAAQLPAGLKDALPESGPGERFGVEEFYRRVAEEEHRDCTPAQARQHARAVVAALRVGLSEGEFDDFAAQLPKDYDDLLGTSPVQH